MSDSGEATGCTAQRLNFAAAVLCGAGGLATLVAAVASDEPRTTVARAALASGLLGTVGSIAWALSAYQDLAACQAAATEVSPPAG